MNGLPILIADGLTDNQIKFMNSFVATYCNVSRACENANISRQTFYHWGRESDNFAKAVEQAREAVKDRVEQEVYRHIFEDRNPIVLNKFAPKILKDRGLGDVQDINLNSDVKTDNEVVITVIDGNEQLEHEGQSEDNEQV